MPIRLALALAAAAAALAACAEPADPPPRNPLAAPSPTAAAAPATASPEPDAAPAPPPAPTAAQDGAAARAPDAAALEVFTGNALELMAEWLGVPATDLRVGSAEALVWPNSCFGAALPQLACAAVPTPGFRAVLLDAHGNPHGVHATAAGAARWRGEATASGAIAAAAGAAITLALDGGGERRFAIAPGTRFESADGSFAADAVAAGLRVVAGFDGSPSGEDAPVLAWLLAAGPP